MDPISIAMALAQFAPGIIKWVTGSDKAQEAAQKVVEVAQAATGTMTGQDALQKLQASPEAVLAFRQALAAQEADLDKAYLADRQSARAMAVDLAKAGQRDIKPWMIAADTLGLVSCVVAIVHFHGVLPPGVETLLTTIATIFGLCLRDAHQFEFGSSRGSQEKSDQLAQLATRVPK